MNKQEEPKKTPITDADINMEVARFDQEIANMEVRLANKKAEKADFLAEVSMMVLKSKQQKKKDIEEGKEKETIKE